MGFFAERIALGQSLFITWWMLTFRRNYVIEKIKAPLVKAIVNLSTLKGKREILKEVVEIIRLCNLYPLPTKERTSKPNTHARLNMQEKFFEYEDNPNRKVLFQAGWRMYAVECEHDSYYCSRDDWLLEEKIKAILRGEWQPRLEGWPKPNHWKEPPPYGGKHSIIYKLQLHKDEILKIIGEV